MKNPGQVHLVGAGPGDPDLLTVRALRLIRAAQVVVHDRLVSAEILALAPQSARRLAVGKAPGCHTVPQERINEILYELAVAGHRVVRLKGGDPFIFGRGSEEAAYLAARGIRVDQCPGITAAQGAACATGVPLTHRGLASGVRYVTGHRQAGRPLDLDWKSLASPDTTLVIYMGVANIGEIARRLMREGLPARLPVLAIAAATTPRETRLISTLENIARDLRGAPAPGPVLFVVGRVVSLYRDAPLADLAADLTADLAAGLEPVHEAIAHA